MNPRRRGLTVLELLIGIIVIVVAVVLLLRLRGQEGPPPLAQAGLGADSAGVIIPAGAGNDLATRLAFLNPMDSTAHAGDTVTVRLRATTEAGTAVARARIALSVTAGGGQLSATSVVTGDTGLAEVRWVLGQESSKQSVHATINGDEAVASTLTINIVPRSDGAP